MIKQRLYLYVVGLFCCLLIFEILFVFWCLLATEPAISLYQYNDNYFKAGPQNES